MSEPPRKTLNRQDVERVVHEALGRQLRLMVGLSALLLVLGFVVGQFTGAALARRNTERLQAQLDQVGRTLAGLESQIDDQRDEHAELEETFIRLERQRRNEIELDRSSLETMIATIEATESAAQSDVDAFESAHRTVPTADVRRLVDRIVAEQTQSMQRLLTSSIRRLQLPESERIVATASRPIPEAPEPPREPPVGHQSIPATANDASVPPGPEPLQENAQPELQESAVELPACRPKHAELAGSQPRPTESQVSEQYLPPPRRRGFLFFAPSQPHRIDETRVGGSDTIPLPPR